MQKGKFNVVMASHCLLKQRQDLGGPDDARYGRVRERKRKREKEKEREREMRS